MTNPRTEFRAMGDGAVLAEPGGAGDSLPLALALRREEFEGVLDVVPAEVSVLIRFDPARLSAADVVRWVRDVRPQAPAGHGSGLVELEVRYDGEDLAEVARLAGTTEADVVARHTATEWLVAFSGFAPGFGYLRPVSGPGHTLEVPRRDEPRTRVPAGSVALAAGYSGVYPRVSPGGWQLIGRTEAALWDAERDPPALLRPGTRVRFRALGVSGPAAARGGPAGSASTGRTDRTARVGARGSQRPGPALKVLRAGPLTTVQDLGRGGWAYLGVPESGAADRASLRLANRLVGNRESEAGLEVTVGGLAVRAVRDLIIAVAGARAPLTIDGPAGTTPVPGRALLMLAAGDTLTIGPAVTGIRAYLAVRGGIDVPPVLGSRSGDVLSGLGPAPLRDGDELPAGDATDGWPVTDLAPGPDLPVGEVALTAFGGPHDEVLTPSGRAALVATTWRVDDRSDRVGLRLAGPALEVRAGASTPSEPMVRGAVQLPPAGRPVVFLADHPVTGGYPVVAVLALAEVDRAAQLRPGQPVRLDVRPPPVFG